MLRSSFVVRAGDDGYHDAAVAAVQLQMCVPACLSACHSSRECSSDSSQPLAALSPTPELIVRSALMIARRYEQK
jgi:hypothetical protein